LFKKSCVQVFIFFVFALLLSTKSYVAAEIVDNQTVEANKIWTIRFNKDVQFNEKINEAIKVTDSKGNLANITLELGEDKKSILVKPPKGGYVNGEGYTINFNTSLKSYTGKSLKEEIEFRFSIESNGKVVFKDPAVEKEVRYIIHKPTEVLTAKDVYDISYIDLNSRKVQSLEGIEHITNLRNLYLYGNNITDVAPLAKLNNLEWLELRNNKISDVSPLGGLSNLEYLYLEGNPIDDLSALSGLTKLVDFSFLGCNNLKDAETKLMNTKQVVSIVDANLEEAIKAKLGKKTGKISVLDAVSISELDISGTKINSLEGIQYFKNLRYINISNCEVDDIKPLSSLKGLMTVNLTNNKIVDISSLEQLTNLHHLYLNGNPVKDISVLYKIKTLEQVEIFNCYSLEEAAKKLQYNAIYIAITDPKLEATIKKELAIGEGNITANDAERLVNLSANYQDIQSLEGLQYFKNLKRVELSYNKVRDISPLKELQNLENLVINHNDVREVSPLKYLQKLSTLDLAYNYVKDVTPLKNLQNLSKLVLQNNPVENIEVLLELKKLNFFFWLHMDDVKKAVTATQKAKEIVAQIVKPGMTEYERERAIHDYVIKNARYDNESVNAGNIPDDSYSPYGLLINKTGVCQAYASTMYMMLNMAGIENVIVLGSVSGGPIDHTWNIVKIDGQYYHLDATWDDPSTEPGSSAVSHDYFNITDGKMAFDHTWKRDDYPKCDNVRYAPEYIKYWNENSIPQGTLSYIRGTISLGEGNMAPQGGVKLRLTASTWDKNNLSYSGGNVSFSFDAFIPEGQNSIFYEMPVIPNQYGYILKYSIVSGILEGYLQYGYFYDSNAPVADTLDNYSPLLIKSGSDRTIDFSIKQLNVIKGIISLTDGHQAQEIMGFNVWAVDTGTGTTYNTHQPVYIDYYGSSSNQYVLTVGKDVANYIVYIEAFVNGIPKRYYYNKNGCVEDKSAATTITAGNGITTINISYDPE
jgi:Leucine-rich repeat (LRR) protein